MSSTHVEIITLEKVVYSGDVESVVVPGAEGQLGILANHASLMSILSTGLIRLISEGNEVRFNVDGGFIEVNKNSVTILADSCETVE
ncbi:MAG: ATP synthase F1 subunit epsilon [Dehalococcoidia bacterium]|jgi:F-type H+-transporting ATPase subunit epsilon|nr:ATP synthase F1 subunit epsilon [Dehalococcoidia bacterium]MBN41540.1 ATP synthase F1 subunit epsilon [Chloroflexota bacterium]MQG17147.1 ATP synthase F1 subunit epsilon [SAR202 cluster bacterium]MCH2528255.1 ATP synthase F1 subunit epsilon [Dehalococcoidia bacterium]MQG25338.1 ATP synthase F1 subunit epsilon [SAR202 cluster bacterium]|tara:strand:- start:557 stop:817 length:261 start_codon:yes stop_codon:yes gene_type:complete